MKKQNFSKPNYLINDEIRYEGKVRVVNGDNGEDSDIVPMYKARQMADEAGLDLIQVSFGEMPVIKIANYEKMVYQMKRNAKKNMHKSKPMKEIQISVGIAINDIKTKVNHARDFINDGSRVKVILTMRGREKARRDENKKSLYEFITMLEDVAVPEMMPKDEGDSKTIVILKKKN
jgi:translation initiation factor IF-3